MNKIILTTCLLASLLISCSPKISIPFQRTGSVEYVEGDKNTITVSANGYAATEANAVYYAERNALENILFRGIPNSNQENPMLENEASAYTNNKKALDDLTMNDGYRKFMIQSYRDQITKQGGAYNLTQIVKFDLQALRKHLESNNLKRKFGL